MYERFFELSARPFAAAPAPDWYFPAATIEAARHNLGQTLERGAGFGLVVAPAGLGKSLLCLVLAEAFRTTHAVALLNSGRISTRRMLYQAVLHELGLPFRGLDEGELRLSLVDRLLGPEYPQGLLLLVDEAHTLPLRLLDELRLLSNVSQGGRGRMALVLCGAPVLEEKLASSKLESFNQRIVARHYLGPLDSQETELFVRSQLQAAGRTHEGLFTPEALARIHRATDGVPRLINQLCDHALVLAFAGGVAQIDAAGIDEAWADLQQLPTPWPSEASRGAAPDEVLEFGTLDDAAEEPARAPAVATPQRSAAETGPEQRLEQIDASLRQLQEDFRPAGKIGPEVEVAYYQPCAAGPHDFDEEEVVIDVFSDWKQGPVRTTVLSRGEESELATLLRPFVEPEEGAVEIEAEPVLAGAPAATQASPLVAGGRTLSGPASFEPVPRPSGLATPGPAATASRSPEATSTGPAAAVAEAPAPRPSPPAAPTTGVGPRRREFQNLFSRLKQN